MTVNLDETKTNSKEERVSLEYKIPYRRKTRKLRVTVYAIQNHILFSIKLHLSIYCLYLSIRMYEDASLQKCSRTDD